MNINKVYDVLIIGGGISACVFASNFLKNNQKFKGKIALIEAGHGLGGRSSTRISNRFTGWELNHGSPNFNICNNGNNAMLQNYIDDLLKNNIIKFDDSEITQLVQDSTSNIIKTLEFNSGDNYFPLSSMSELCQNIISLNDLRGQVEFYFESLILHLDFKDNKWILVSKKGDIFKSKHLVCSSNLLLHKRSTKVLNTNQIPIRNAIGKNKEPIVDLLIQILNLQAYLPRATFLIYTNKDYQYKDFYKKKCRQFFLDQYLENIYKFERLVFQRQKDNKLGIVIHSKNIKYIDNFINENNEDKFKQILLKRFNKLFKHNPYINQILNIENISIMRWRASQPKGAPVPLSLQFSKHYKIGFCGDWFAGDGFGRVEGAIMSALTLANKFKSLIN